MSRLIDADELHEKLNQLSGYSVREPDSYDFGRLAGIREAIMAVNNLPTVHAEPVRHGEWYYDGCVIKCSACHDTAVDGFQTDYCPNCGARMDGGKTMFYDVNPDGEVRNVKPSQIANAIERTSPVVVSVRGADGNELTITNISIDVRANGVHILLDIPEALMNEP